jgi:hypothetical protein
MVELQVKQEVFEVVIVWYLDSQLSVQSVSITTKVVISNPTHGEEYSVEHNVIVCQWLASIMKIPIY